MNIEFVSVKDLKPNPKNRNKHPKDQIERLAKIISEQGFRRPIIVSNQSGLVVVGHGRLMAAKKLKLETVPVIYQDYATPELEYADQVADNAIALWAELDFSGINSDVPDLGPDFDIDLLGIKNFEIDVSDKEPGCDEDEVPEKVEPKSKLGDIYQLGNHRLMCGDSTSIDAVEKLMNGEKADMVFTDPPYGINYDAKDLNLKTSSNFGKIKNDDGSLDLDFMFSDLVPIKIIWGANCFPKKLPHRGRWICWYKRGDGAENAIGSPMELAWVDIDHGYDRHYKIVHGGFVNSDGGKRVHPTQKPILLAQKCFEDFKAEKNILDYFGGSGSTLIACEKTNRKCYMMELDPHYIDVIVARWEKYTGKKAELING